MSRNTAVTLAMRKSIGMRHTALVASSGKSKGVSHKSISKKTYPRFFVCVDNEGYEASLQLGKIYKAIKPERNDHIHDLRIIDEEGEDYLYPATRFSEVQLTPRARRAVAHSVPSA